MSAKPIEIPTLEDDGLETPEVGSWAEEKYRLVKLYASVFTTSIRDKWDELVYLDLFAGCGRARLRDSGRIVPASPFLALTLEHPFGRYIFCERDFDLLNVLQRRVQGEHPEIDARYIQGDVNQQAPRILGQLPRPSSQYKVLAFCFVDPFGLKNLHFETLATLADRYMDFLVLVPTGYDATRNEERYLEEDDETVGRFLGLPGWREEWVLAKQSGRTFDRFMTDTFGQCMSSLHYIYEDIDSTQLVRSTEKNLRLYRLVFFSRHKLGAKFWAEVRKSASPQRNLPF